MHCLIVFETELMYVFQEPVEGRLHVEETEGGMGVIQLIPLVHASSIWVATIASDDRIVVIPHVLG